MRTSALAFLFASALLVMAAETINTTTTTIYGFGTDFSSQTFHRVVFEVRSFSLPHPSTETNSFPKYGLAVEDNADVVFTSVPLEGIKCGYEGNTNEECASVFHLYANPGLKLDFDSRHLSEVASSLEIDFAVSPEPLTSDLLPDLQNYPAFVYGVAPLFNIPGVSKLVLTKQTLARIFRGCDVAVTEDCLPDSITQWNDAAILETNPTVTAALTAAGPIKVFLSADETPTTFAFKAALARFDTVFYDQVGDGKDTTWRGTSFESIHGTYGALRKVESTPGSISYGNMHQILQLPNVHVVELIVDEEGHVVYPNTKSLHAAMIEVGLQFGNDGSHASKMTVDLTTATGIASWPISLFAYISIRKDYTPRNCQARKLGVLSILDFFYRGHGDESTAYNSGLTPLYKMAGLQMIETLRQQLRCDGVPVYVAPKAPPRVRIMAEPALHSLLNTFVRDAAGQYRTLIQLPLTTEQLKESFACESSETEQCDASLDLVNLADETLSRAFVHDQLGLFTMPYVAISTGFIYNFCANVEGLCAYRYSTPLVLDIKTAARILDGHIRWWNDTEIVTLNRDKLLPQEPITVITAARTSSYHMDFVQRVRTSYVTDFEFQLGGNRSMYSEAWMDVSINRYSFSFTLFNGTSIEGVEPIALRNKLGMDVAASPASIEACAMDTFDPETKLFYLDRSNHTDCYPLTSAFNLFVVNPLETRPPALLMKTLYRQSLRKATGKTAISVNQFGTLTDLKLDNGIDLEQLNFDALETLLYADSGESILRIPHNFNWIPRDVITGLYVTTGMEVVIFLALAVWVIRYRNRKLIRNSSPLFMLQVLFGATLMAITVVPLSLQDDQLIPRAMTKEEMDKPDPTLNIACVANPIFFSIGFFICYSAIFLKAWRLIRIFNNAKLKNLYLRDRQLVMYQTVVVNVIIVLNVLWAGIDPMIWVRFPEYENADGMVIASRGVCYSRGGVKSAVPLIIGIVLLLIVGNYLSYLGRRIPTEFNESKWTAMAMMMILESFIIAVPVLILANEEPVSGFIVKALVCLLAAGGTVGLIFIPKIMLAYGWGENMNDSNPWRFVRPSDSSGGASNSKNNSKVAHQLQPPQHKNVMLSQLNNSSVNEHTVPAMSPVASQLATTNYPSASKSTSEALARILHDDPSRRKFRRFLKTLKMEENVRFWDATMLTKAEPNENKRYAGTRALIQTFVMDNSPLQINLASATKQELLEAFNKDDKEQLKDPLFFDKAMNELFNDLKQSDAFRAFLDQDTFSTANLA